MRVRTPPVEQVALLCNLLERSPWESASSLKSFPRLYVLLTEEVEAPASCESRLWRTGRRLSEGLLEVF